MANRLQHATSPYLLQHAHNLVDWHPWEAEALARANLEDVGAKAGNLLRHCFRRAIAERHHRHHRGDADNDAERSEEGA